jgi:hypothetical protein
MSKLRTTPTQNLQHSKAEDFHNQLEKGAKTAAVHREKVRQSDRDLQLKTELDSGHGHSQAAHLTAGGSIKPQSKRPIGDPNAGQHPGALLKR